MYMYMIDNVYKQQDYNSEDFLKQLKSKLVLHPTKFENDFKNLKSFVIDLEEERKRLEELDRLEKD